MWSSNRFLQQIPPVCSQQPDSPVPGAYRSRKFGGLKFLAAKFCRNRKNKAFYRLLKSSFYTLPQSWIYYDISMPAFLQQLYKPGLFRAPEQPIYVLFQSRQTSQVFFFKFDQVITIFCRRIHGKYAVGKFNILSQTAEDKGFCLTQCLFPRIIQNQTCGQCR